MAKPPRVMISAVSKFVVLQWLEPSAGTDTTIGDSTRSESEDQARLLSLEEVGMKPIKPTPSMTAELASKAITLVNTFGLKQHQAAAILGLNQGRISEVLTGKRFPHAVPYPPDQLRFDF
jgi:hypothetical protein